MFRSSGPGLLALLAAATLPAAGCIWIFHHVEVASVSRPADSVAVESPVKAHLANGFTVVYPQGVRVVGDTVRGSGTRYDLQLRDATPVSQVPLDSVVAMESFETQVDAGTSFAVSTLVSVGVPALAIAIYCATNPKCFGSCPTFYSDTGGGLALEAEGFSYSIAPLFEARDVDRLRAQADARGELRLEVRNEAIETHYLNQLALLEVRHQPAEFLLPNDAGEPLAVRHLAPPATARDRAGRDVRQELAAADGVAYRTDSATLATVRPGDVGDFVDLTFPAPAGADTVALVLRLRNSLLNTVLLYDLMLGTRGARALDWVGKDLERVGPAVALGQWYATRMGLRISVWDGSRYREVSRISDTGPVAWKDVAAVVPVPQGDSVRLRLAFVADNWRIDRVALAGAVRRAPAREWDLARVIGADGTDDTNALASLRIADRRYLQTSPGQRFGAVFQPGAAPAGDSARTFFLVSQGYYIEWIRRAWLAAGVDSTPFVPSDAELVAALKRWRTDQPDLERRFAATRVPVR